MRSRGTAWALASLILAAAPAPSTGAAAPEGPAGGNEPGTGALVAKAGGSLVPLPIVSMSADLAITGPMVRATVRQEFRNDASDPVEAVYLFPLPEGAAVDGLVLDVAGKRYRGRIEENAEAKRIYETAKAEGKRAGLLEQHRPNIFRTRVANIPPHGAVAVELTYLASADFTDGAFSTVFPMKITPRYDPAATEDPGGAAGIVPEVSLHGTLDAGVPLGDVSSPSHAIHTAASDRGATIAVGDGPVPADRDFVLRWRPKASAAPLSGAIVENRTDGRYALAMVVPPSIEGEGGRGFPTQTVFVVDVSGSMEGPSIEQAKAALDAALDRLRPGDTFTIIRFASGNAAYSESLLPADGKAVANAKGWVNRLVADGGTEILPALLHALAISEAGDASALKRVVLITDGAVDNEEEVFRAVEAHLGGTRLHVVGIGPAPNRWLMRELARAGRGTYTAIGNLADVGTGIASLLERTERAVMTDVALEWKGAAPLEAFPDPVPDLYAGKPLVVTAKLDPSKPEPSLRVWGRAPGGPITMSTDLSVASAGSGVATRWARAKIASLEGARMHGADPAIVKADVVDLSKRFSIVSPYTSFVVVDDEAAEEAAAQDGADLPQGGTLEPLLLALGALLAATGGALLVDSWRSERWAA